MGSRGARVANGQQRTRLAARRWRRPHLRTGGSRGCEAEGRRRAASEGASHGGALRIWRVPRTAGVTGIQTCSPRRPVRQGKRERNGSVLTCLDGFLGVSRSRTPLGQVVGTESQIDGGVPRHRAPNHRRRLTVFLLLRKAKTAASSLPWVSFAESLLWPVEISPNLPSVRPG